MNGINKIATFRNTFSSKLNSNYLSCEWKKINLDSNELGLKEP
jgi:hypothetical protein